MIGLNCMDKLKSFSTALRMPHQKAPLKGTVGPMPWSFRTGLAPDFGAVDGSLKEQLPLSPES